MKRDIQHHVAVMIIESSRGNQFLMGLYDNTYPLKVFRERVNLIGGNQHPEDYSPRGILERELTEEFSIRHTQEKSIEEAISRTSGKGVGALVPKEFASQDDIDRIRNFLLAQYAAYKDFHIDAPYIKHIPNAAAIYSVFKASLPYDLFECARENLRLGKSIKSEGFATIMSADDLKKGTLLSAGGTPVIMSDYLNSPIPDPYGLRGEDLGAPRSSLAEYETEFNYVNVQRKK